MKFLIYICLLFCFACSSVKTREVTVSNYVQDLRFALNELEKLHPNLYFKSSKKHVRELENRLLVDNILTREQLIFSLMKILNLIGDSHTAIDLSGKDGFEVIVPKFYRQNDSLFLSAVEPHQIELLGQEIIEINGRPTNEVLQSLDKISTFENQSQKWSASEYLVAIPKLLQLMELGKFQDQIEMKILIDGKVKTYVFQVPKANFDRVYFKKQPPLWLSRPSSTYYWATEMEKRRVLYLQYNACKEMKDKSFAAFVDEVVALSKKNENVSKSLIIDLRKNSGGNSSVITPLFEALKSQRLKINKITVIVSRKTFSSAILNALTLKKDFNAQIVGEATGGSPSHFGEQKSFVLPLTNIEVKYSTKYFKNALLNTDSLYPDKSIPFDHRNIGSSADDALDASLRMN
jgi:hypothetical protein